MAKIYVKNTDGTYIPQPSVLVSNLDIVQDKGDSLTSAMSQKAITDELKSKQDTISDLDAIRQGAEKGSTALQSYTESDPIYTADKPNLALKSELNGKVDKEEGKGLSSNDYTDEEKVKLSELDTQINGGQEVLEFVPTQSLGHYYEVSGTRLLIRDAPSSHYTPYGDDASNPIGVDISRFIGLSLEVILTGAISPTSSRSTVITDSNNIALLFKKESEYTDDENGKKHIVFSEIPSNAKYLYWSVGLSTIDVVRVSSFVEGLVDTKQDLLVSGDNIKTINGESILGSGNIEWSEPKDIEITPVQTQGYYYDSGANNSLAIKTGTFSWYSSFGGDASHPIGIDISEYVGKKLHIVFPSISASSARLTAITNANNTLLKVKKESDYVLTADGKYDVYIAIPMDAKYLYVSGTAKADKVVVINEGADSKIVLFESAARAERAGGLLKTPPISFLHFSDLHGSEKNLRIYADIARRYKDYISDTINTGDTVMYYLGDGTESIMSSIFGASQMMNAIGNHDAMSNAGLTEYATLINVYNAFIKPYVSSWGVIQPTNAESMGLCYYYKDYTSNKLRLIVLDCMHWDEAQLMWLGDVLDDAKVSGYTVAIAVHYPSGRINGIDNHWHSFDFDLIRDNVAVMASAAVERVELFIDNGGKFACWITGHSHCDAFGKIAGHDKQLCITIDTASDSSLHNIGRNPVVDTDLQYCANVVTIDTYSSLIKVFRLGAEYDRTLRHIGTISYDYKNHKVVTSS